jgi:hypothetical protein
MVYGIDIQQLNLGKFLNLKFFDEIPFYFFNFFAFV